MAWERCVMTERHKFVLDCIEGNMSMTEVCRRHGISRRVGYKWLARYADEGIEGLRDRSRAPLTRPSTIEPFIVDRIVEYKGKHMTWGPKKICSGLARKYPTTSWPAVSTVGEILDRHGLVTRRKKRHRAKPSTEPLSHCIEPNDVWCIDFKGWFRTQDGARCDPLTLCDGASRYGFRCTSMNTKTNTQAVQACLEVTFREFGLPKAIRSDNGPPFASTGLAGLSQLSAWWTRLGITHERIRPGHPGENGRIERFHRTLKAESIAPAQKTIRLQQLAFNRFLKEYNFERPHESLGQRVPADVYIPSRFPFPDKLPHSPEYDSTWQVRKVKHSGTIKWKGQDVYVTQALRHQHIGLKQTDDRTYVVHWCEQAIGKLDTGKMKITSLDTI